MEVTRDRQQAMFHSCRLPPHLSLTTNNYQLPLPFLLNQLHLGRQTQGFEQ